MKAIKKLSTLWFCWPRCLIGTFYTRSLLCRFSVVNEVRETMAAPLAIYRNGEAIVSEGVSGAKFIEDLVHCLKEVFCHREVCLNGCRT